MGFDLIFDFGEVELGALLHSECGAIVEVVEKMLERVGAGIGVFRKGLKNAEVTLRGVKLSEAAFDHSELVVAGGGLAADFYVTVEKIGGFRETFCSDAQIGKFEKGVGEIRIRP